MVSSFLVSCLSKPGLSTTFCSDRPFLVAGVLYATDGSIVCRHSFVGRGLRESRPGVDCPDVRTLRWPADRPAEYDMLRSMYGQIAYGNGAPWRAWPPLPSPESGDKVFRCPSCVGDRPSRMCVNCGGCGRVRADAPSVALGSGGASYAPRYLRMIKDAGASFVPGMPTAPAFFFGPGFEGFLMPCKPGGVALTPAPLDR